MGRYRRRQQFRHVIRSVLAVAVVLGLLVGALSSLGAGNPALFLAVAPMSFFAALFAAPFVILALVIAVIATALPLAILTAVLGGPLYLLYRLLGGGRPREEDGVHGGRLTASSGPAFQPEAVLRRRYVAGELTYQQFQAGMVELLKERFTRGDLALSEYEAELEKLLEPARRLDVARDPALASALPERKTGRTPRSV